MALGFKNDGVLVQEYFYDFAADGGAIGTVTLSAKDGKAPLPVGAIVLNSTTWVKDAVTSGGAATVSIGLGTDVDGLLTAQALGALTANAVIVGDGAAAVPASSATYISSAANGAVTASIAVAAATAGQISVSVEYIYPAGQ